MISNKQLLLPVVLCMISIVILGLVLLHQPMFFDEKIYIALADNLIHKGTYTTDGVNLTAYRPIGYPLFLSLMRSAGLSIMLCRWCNALLCLINVVLVVKIVNLKYTAKIAQAAGIYAALYPLIISTGLFLYPQTISATYVLALLYIAMRTISLQASILFGLLSALLTLTVPGMALVPACFMLWIWFKSHSERPKIVLSCLICLLAISPWVIRNMVVFHSPVISTNGGVNFLIGVVPDATPRSGTNVDMTREYAALGSNRKLNEVEVDRAFRRRALNYVRADYKRYTILTAGKFLQFFSFRDDLKTKVKTQKLASVAVAVSYYPLLFTCVAFLFIKGNLTSETKMLIAVYLLAAFFHSLFFPRLRFRAPYDYLLVIATAMMYGQYLMNRQRAING